jgi:hypothetical protein
MDFNAELAEADRPKWLQKDAAEPAGLIDTLADLLPPPDRISPIFIPPLREPVQRVDTDRDVDTDAAFSYPMNGPPTNCRSA